MGPFSTEQIKTSIQKKEISKSDKIASSEKKTWQTLEAVPEFRDIFLPPLATAFSLPLPPPIFGKKSKIEERESSLPPMIFPPVEIVKPEVSSTKKGPSSIKARNPSSKKRGKKATKAKKTPTSSLVTRKVESSAAEPTGKFLPAENLPQSPSVAEIFSVESPVSSQRSDETITETATETPTTKKIEIRLVIPELSKKQMLFVAASIFSLVVLSGFTLQFFAPKKGAEEFRTPPPLASSIEEPSERNDPIPSLKAPTRPNRD